MRINLYRKGVERLLSKNKIFIYQSKRFELVLSELKVFLKIFGRSVFIVGRSNFFNAYDSSVIGKIKDRNYPYHVVFFYDKGDDFFDHLSKVLKFDNVFFLK